MLKNIKGSMLIVMAALLVYSCADPNKSPIVTFDSAGKGAYPRLTDSQGEQLVNILSQADFDASSFTWSLRFIDVNQGADVAEYALNVTYETVGGTTQGPVELKKFSSADFTTDETGFVAINNVSITASELTGAFGLSLADLTAGDEFQLRGVLVMRARVS